jgi:hypothetical protein
LIALWADSIRMHENACSRVHEEDLMVPVPEYF